MVKNIVFLVKDNFYRMQQLSEDKRRLLIVMGMFYLAFISLMHKWGHQGDMMFWMDWTKYMYNHGFTHIYDDRSCNYLPAYLYFLLLHIKLQGNLTDIQDNLYTIKYYTFFFDLAGAYLAIRYVKDTSKQLFYFIILLFNIAYFYNTAIWGQVDAIFTFFGFVAIILAIEKKAIASALSLLLALNFKLQALVFIPMVGLLLLPQYLNKNGGKKLLMTIVFAIGIQILILLPFILSGRVNQIMYVIFNSVGHYPYPTVGAFNLWSLLLYNTSIDGMLTLSDTIKFGFLSYRQIGSLLFFIFTLLAIFPFVYYLYRRFFKNEVQEFPLSKIFLISALVALNFYFFNTQMHERYAHPAIILLAAYAFLSYRFFPFVLISVAYFLNMVRITWYLALHNDTYMTSIAFNPILIATMYLIGIGSLFYLLYVKKDKCLTVLEW